MPGERTTLEALYTVLKNELKIRAITYRDVAQAMETTQSSIKMRFAHRNLSITQLIIIAGLLNMTLTELMQKVERPAMQELTLEQEIALARDPRLLLVLRQVMDDYSIAETVARYHLDEAQCIKYLLELDRLELIDLLPNNVVRKRMRRNTAWVPNGPLYRLMAARIGDYLSSPFDQPFERLTFSRAELTDAAIAALQVDMRYLQNRIDTLHEECKFAPARERRKILLMAAEREWELPELRALRRSANPQDTAKFLGKLPAEAG